VKTNETTNGIVIAALIVALSLALVAIVWQAQTISNLQAVLHMILER